MLCFMSRVRSACTLLLLPIVLISPTADAAIPCNATHNPCEDHLFPGSQCKNGYCTNPFEGGCLKSMLSDKKYAGEYDSGSAESILRRRVLNVQRVCNSEDSKSSPFCQPTTDDSYSEVRIRSQNWESAIATAWILQIILSEVLNVPATIETGLADKNVNFYDEENRMDYGVPSFDDNYVSFQNAFDAEGGDCAVYKSETGRTGGEDYVSCAHVAPEEWTFDTLSEKEEKGVVAAPDFSGAIALEGWYITKFSTGQDPSLALYTGYQGLENRQKLVERFKRPTTWGEYCSLVSADNCSTKDEVADRAPADNVEDGRYFVEGSYTGYFRANNCTNATECTGHFMDYQCGWTSYFKQQAYHLNISLESNGNDPSGDGYSYASGVEIWKAANATKSDLIGYWFQPDATFSSFMGTDAELIRVALPSVTEKCTEARVPNDLRCDESASFLEKVGEKEGACDERAFGLRKIVVGNLKSNIEQSKSPKAAMSPAFDLIEDLQITELQLDKLLLEWSSRGIDRYNFDLRFATCEWLADNLEFITKLIPETHPRSYIESSFQSSPIEISALFIGTLAVSVTVAAAFLVSGILKCQPIAEKATSIRKNSQIQFVYTLLVGLFFVPVGALLLAWRPSKATCISSVWLLNVGYTLVLVPTLVRVSAILKVLQAGRQFRRVKVDKKRLLKTSLGISALAAIFCALWTGLDPMTVKEQLRIADETNDLGETVVWVSYYCESESGAWFWVSFVWQSLLLITGSVLAFQMRAAPKTVNDSAELAFMVYSSFIFLILRIVLHIWASTIIEGFLTRRFLQTAQSLLWSIDSVMNVCIYFSKFFRKEEDDDWRSSFAVVNGRHVERRHSLLHRQPGGILRPRPLVEVEEEKAEGDEPTGQRRQSLLNRQPGGILRVRPLVEVEEEKVEEDEPAVLVAAAPPQTGVPLGNDNSGKDHSPLIFRTAVSRMTDVEPLWGYPLWDKNSQDIDSRPQNKPVTRKRRSTLF